MPTPNTDGPAWAPVAESPVMRRLMRQVERLAQSEVPVLVLGETGAGKEVMARAIHAAGPRAAGPLGCLNCGALPEQLVERTLFGYAPGAAGGFDGPSEGIFEASRGGSVLLDKVGELPPSAQLAVLRVLETRRFVPVGGTRELPIDVRILAATHRDLEAMCEDGRFRRDLYYRLNVLTLEVPPLRHRLAEVPPLATRFLHEACAREGRSLRGFSPAAVGRLLAYTWPGNVRELRNVVERAVVVAEGAQVELGDLPSRLLEATGGPPEPSTLLYGSEPAGGGRPDPAGGRVPSPQSADPLDPSGEAPAPFKAQMRRHEIDVILQALDRTANNQTEAAKLLQMPLRTLVHKIKQHDIRRIIQERGA